MKKYKKKRKVNKKIFTILILVCISISIGLVINYKIKGYYFNYLKDTKKVSYKIIKESLNELEGSIKIIKKDYEWSEKLINDNEPNKLIIHHTVGDKLTPEQIHEDHKSKGYDGIGYHYYIRKSGEVFKGRPDEAQGAHTIGENRKSIAICLEGNFENQKLNKSQSEALVNLCKYLIVKYNLYSVIGHKDAYNTLCPGKNVSIENINAELKEFFSQNENLRK